MNQGTLVVEGNITVQMVSSYTVWIRPNNIIVCTETTSSKPVNLENTRTVILPPTASVLWINNLEMAYLANTKLLKIE